MPCVQKSTARISACRTARDRKQSRREKSKVNMVWKGYRSRLHKCNDFNAYGLFSRDSRDDELVGAEFTAFPDALVQIQNASGLGFEIRISRKDPAAVLPRTDGVLAQPSPDGGVTDGCR